MAPTRKPKELKLLDGSYRPDRHGTKTQLPEGNSMPAPDDLGEVGRDVWDRLFEFMREWGLIKDPDIDQFHELCRLYDKVAECDAYIKEHGIWYESPKGALLRHPACVQRRDYVTEKMRLIQYFGMTPSGRANLDLQEPQKAPVVNWAPLKRG